MMIVNYTQHKNFKGKNYDETVTKIGRKQFGKLATKHLKCYLPTNGTTIEIYRNKNITIGSYDVSR